MLTYKSNHVAEAIAHLLGQYKGTNLETFLTIYVSQLQEVEDMLWDMHNVTIDTASGVELDELGDIVGQAREDRTDEEYRLAIRVRIAINLCDGTPEKMIAILKGVTGDSAVSMVEYYPASLICQIADAMSILTIDEINSIFQSTKPAGVGADLVFGLVDSTGWFTCDTGPGFDDGVWCTVAGSTDYLVLINTDSKILQNTSGATLLA